MPGSRRGRDCDIRRHRPVEGTGSGTGKQHKSINYERADPILLKCDSSPHIYLLEWGQKRWIRDIPALTAEGYRWSDVVTWVSCEDLRAVPDGETIPPGSGPPPQP